jgi:hypothetical protein
MPRVHVAGLDLNCAVRTATRLDSEYPIRNIFTAVANLRHLVDFRGHGSDLECIISSNCSALEQQQSVPNNLHIAHGVLYYVLQNHPRMTQRKTFPHRATAYH